MLALRTPRSMAPPSFTFQMYMSFRSDRADPRSAMNQPDAVPVLPCQPACHALLWVQELGSVGLPTVTPLPSTTRETEPSPGVALSPRSNAVAVTPEMASGIKAASESVAAAPNPAAAAAPIAHVLTCFMICSPGATGMALCALIHPSGYLRYALRSTEKEPGLPVAAVYRRGSLDWVVPNSAGSFTPNSFTRNAHVSAASSISFNVGLPAPWPARVSMRISTGLSPA